MTHSHDDPSGDFDPAELPASLKLLRGMVFALLAVMITGFIVLIWIFVTRLGTAGTDLPPGLTLPVGESPAAVTLTSGTVIVVTDSDRIFLYDRGTGTLTQEIDFGSDGSD